MTKHKILIVDDEVDITDALSIFFRNRDFDVIAVNKPENVAGILEEDTSIELLIMDVKMPVMRGIDVFRFMRERGIDTPVIFLTGSIALGKYIQELESLGFDESNFLGKPIDLRILLEKVQAILGD